VLGTAPNITVSSYALSVNDPQGSLHTITLKAGYLERAGFEGSATATLLVRNALPTAELPRFFLPPELPRGGTLRLPLAGHDNDERGSAIVAGELALDGTVVGTPLPGTSFGLLLPRCITPGLHQVSYRVLDDEGTWSPAAVLAFTVVAPTFSVALEPGWNLISFPFALDDPDVVRVLSTCGRTGTVRAGPVWGWDAETEAYRAVERFAPFTGYWVFAPAPTQLAATGTALADTTVELRPAWNLVGVATEALLPATPAVLKPAWGWDPVTTRYTEVDRLFPGAGYWVRATEPTRLVPARTSP